MPRHRKTNQVRATVGNALVNAVRFLASVIELFFFFSPVASMSVVLTLRSLVCMNCKRLKLVTVMKTITCKDFCFHVVRPDTFFSNLGPY